MPFMTSEQLAREVAQVMADVLVHQRVRWGAMLGYQRQFEGWWKAEITLALEGWTWRSDVLSRQNFGVWPEAKPRDFGLGDERSAVDIAVIPWNAKLNEFDHEARPRAWIELKTRGTWWGTAAKAFGAANSGLYTDLAKWKGADNELDAFLICQVTSHDGSRSNVLRDDWRAELDNIASTYHRLVERTVGFEIPGGRDEVRWTRLDCFLVNVRQ